MTTKKDRVFFKRLENTERRNRTPFSGGDVLMNGEKRVSFIPERRRRKFCISFPGMNRAKLQRNGNTQIKNREREKEGGKQGQNVNCCAATRCQWTPVTEHRKRNTFREIANITLGRLALLSTYKSLWRRQTRMKTKAGGRRKKQSKR